MDLQNIFYSIGIVFMGVGIFVGISIFLLLFYIRIKVGQINMHVLKKINSFFDPANIALHLGNAMIKKVKSLLEKKVV